MDVIALTVVKKLTYDRGKAVIPLPMKVVGL